LTAFGEVLSGAGMIESAANAKSTDLSAAADFAADLIQTGAEMTFDAAVGVLAGVASGNPVVGQRAFASSAAVRAGGS